MTKGFLPLWAASLVTLIYAQAPLFHHAPPAAVGAGSGHLVLADVNRDGKLDLLAQHLQQRIVTVQLGDGTGRFTPAPGSPYRAGPGAYHLAIGDVNRDGKPDVAASSFEGKTATVLLGQ